VRTLENHNHLFQRSIIGSPAEYGALPEPISRDALDLIVGWLRVHM
jgi:hypothetical protein